MLFSGPFNRYTARVTNSVLPFIPGLYPGEIVYSFVARYSRLLGDVPRRQINDQLFGGQTAALNPSVPNCLAAFSSALTPRVSVDALLRDHTLFAYHGVFRDAETRALARSEALSQGAPLHQLGAIIPLAGVLKHLRFCPACDDEARTIHGEAYWRRDHQLPEQLICPVHLGV